MLGLTKQRHSSLRNIAAPDPGVQRAANSGIVPRYQNLSTPRLAAVSLRIRLGCTDTLEAWETGNLAEPSANEDVLEVICGARRLDLSERAGIEFVNHLAIAGHDLVHCVSFQYRVTA